MSSVGNISFVELIIALTVAFLLANTSLVLIMGGAPFMERGVSSVREGFQDMFSGVSMVPPRGCGLGRPAFGNAQRSPWGAQADVNGPYNTGAYPFDPRVPDLRRALRSPKPLAVKGACRPVMANPGTEREAPNSIIRNEPRQCRDLPYALTSDIPGENDLWPQPMDSADGLGFGSGLQYATEGFSGNQKSDKEPAPMNALSSANGAKFNLIFNQS